MTETKRKAGMFRRAADRTAAQTLVVRWSAAIVLLVLGVIYFFVHPIIEHLLGHPKPPLIDWDVVPPLVFVLAAAGLLTYQETSGWLASVAKVFSWRKGKDDA